MAIDCDFPTTLDAIPTDVGSGDTILSTTWNKYFDAIAYLERTVGVTNSAVTSSHEWRINNYPTAATSGVRSRIVQVVNSTTGAVSANTTLFAWDDTIPQNTEGFEVMAATITPISTANKLLIEVVVQVSHSAVTWETVALYQDSTANALAAMTEYLGAGGSGCCITLKHYMTAGTTNATTFKVRVGGTDSGTTTLNGNGGSRYFGGVMSSSITITEIGV